MKKNLIVMAMLLSLTLGGCAKPNRVADAQPTPSQTPPNLTPIAVPSVVYGKEYPGKGVVLLINKKEGWVEIEHEEIKDLMPAMVMEWPLKKPSQMNTVKVGDKVEFLVVEEPGKGQYLSDLKKIQ